MGVNFRSAFTVEPSLSYPSGGFFVRVGTRWRASNEIAPAAWGLARLGRLAVGSYAACSPYFYGADVHFCTRRLIRKRLVCCHDVPARWERCGGNSHEDFGRGIIVRIFGLCSSSDFGFCRSNEWKR